MSARPLLSFWGVVAGRLGTQASGHRDGKAPRCNPSRSEFRQTRTWGTTITWADRISVSFITHVTAKRLDPIAASSARPEASKLLRKKSGRFEGRRLRLAHPQRVPPDTSRVQGRGAAAGGGGGGGRWGGLEAYPPLPGRPPDAATADARTHTHAHAHAHAHAHTHTHARTHARARTRARARTHTHTSPLGGSSPPPDRPPSAGRARRGSASPSPPTVVSPRCVRR